MTVTPKKSTGVVHFGERLRASKFGHAMTREMYAYPSRSPHQRHRRENLPPDLWEAVSWAYSDEEHAELSDAFLLTQRDAALVNFDLSLNYFASLDADEFEVALQHALSHGGGFKQVQSLAKWDGVEGVYVMVFDEYRQFYVGQSGDVRQRIKAHWSKRKSFDRLLWGGPYDSILAVDELRALDNTRIYAKATTNPSALEQRTEAASDRRFCLNRIMGGRPEAMTFVGVLRPRGRAHGGTVAVMTRDDFKAAIEHIKQVIGKSRALSEESCVEELAAMDMTVFVVSREDGSEFMWSRRDGIRGAATRGELSLEAYCRFLEAMGETVVWPPPRPMPATAYSAVAVAD